jgi:hypothetical protein
MNDTAITERLLFGFSAALGLIGAGAGNALLNPRPRWARTAVAAAGLAVATGAALALIPDAAGTLAGWCAALLVLTSLSRIGTLRRTAAALGRALRKPRVAWSAVAFVGLAAMGEEIIRFERIQESEIGRNEAWMKVQSEENPYIADESRVAKTDRGSGIHLMASAEPLSAEQLGDREGQTILTSPVAEYIIRRGPADDSSNCHGWVFTGGKFAILGREVDTILAENQYEPVTEPLPGDICLYRSDAHSVLHTAIVRSVLEDGTILVEGKWGRLGVFLHPVDKCLYGTHTTYHRTDRGTHILRSIPGSSN